MLNKERLLSWDVTEAGDIKNTVFFRESRILDSIFEGGRIVGRQ